MKTHSGFDESGRPYSISASGYLDKKLVTDLSETEQTVVNGWINTKISKAKKTFPRSSYWLKHLLERETGIYMTNNQFKDAMAINGYRPIDNEPLNWEYRIVLKK